jgi:hypothetical protein
LFKLLLLDTLERRRAARLQGKEAPLIRTIARRLKQLETRAKEVVAAYPEPHTLRFVEPVNKRVVSTYEMGTGKWAHFAPPRDREEFEPIVYRLPTDIGY